MFGELKFALKYKVFKKLKCKFNLVRINTRLIFYERDGKKYLAVVKTGWRGTKWSRHFEIVNEIKT